jgi:putative intracellular protease/amidase
MKLLGKHLLLLVCDGVEEKEYAEIKRGFELESAEVFVSTPQEFMTVETVCDGRRGKDILIDFPLDAISVDAFDGLVIPDGLLSAEGMRKDIRALQLIREFYHRKLPIFASGAAVALLHETALLAENIMVREQGSVEGFVQRATELLMESTSTGRKYAAETRFKRELVSEI